MRALQLVCRALMAYDKLEELADKPGSVENDHSSGTSVTARLKRPTRIHCGPQQTDSYLVLLQVGFTIATPVTSRAVRSYRTFSPLPNPKARRYPFCCTFRGLTPPRRYLAPCPMEPGLSSVLRIKDTKYRDRLANSARRVSTRRERRKRRKSEKRNSAGPMLQ